MTMYDTSCSQYRSRVDQKANGASHITVRKTEGMKAREQKDISVAPRPAQVEPEPECV
jgi:hypothetical protein